MFDTLEQTILSALQIIFDEFGWLGVFGLMVFENATGITPSEIILAAGWMLIERHGHKLAAAKLIESRLRLSSLSGERLELALTRLKRLSAT